MFGIKSVHERCISNEQQYEADDGTLLRHPESEGSIANRGHIGIHPVTEQDAAAQADEEPDG